jgi:hypothetical protein
MISHPSRPITERSSIRQRFLVCFLGLTISLLAPVSHAGNLYVPNFSFESTPTQFADPRVDSWQKAPQPSTFDTNVFGSWDNLVGVFLNPPATNAAHIDNADGNQLAYVFSYPQTGIFQDDSSTDWSGAPATHAFNSTFTTGKTYTLTIGLTSSSFEPLTPGATLELSLYYRDASSNQMKVATTTATYQTNVFTNPTHLIDFQVKVPEVKAGDPWAGQNIGIQIESTVAPNLIGGVWDLESVRLTEEIAVPNFSFESVATQFADPRVDSWQKTPQPPTFDTNVFGAWENLSGLFLNPPLTNAGAIDNAEGTQLGYLFAYTQAGIFQDYSSLDWSNATPTHAFNAAFTTGRSYTLTLGLTSSSQQPLTPGSTLLLSLYYRDAASNRVAVASTTVTFDTNVFANLTHLQTFQVQVPPVRATDAWAGQKIGIAIESIVAPNLIGGVWDVDNVHLIENVAPALSAPQKSGPQMSFQLQSEPGRVFDIQSTTDLSQGSLGWTTMATVTNTTGTTSFTDSNATPNLRFYRAWAR